ncbi:MAG: GatB/YqeY domain-containing protein [Thermacetogeniaceae bacterium]
MTLQERLFNDMKEALKARQPGKQRLSVIRLARAALTNRAIAKGEELNEQDVLDVLAREVKMRRDAILEYTRVGRMDVVAELESEIAILEEYLPRQLSGEEIRELALQAIATTGATEARQVGNVMKMLMPQVRGRADGKIVQEIVRSLLTPSN